MAVKLFPSNFKMYQLSHAVNDASGSMKVRNTRIALIDHATHGTAEEQLQRLLVWLHNNTDGRLISKKAFLGRMFLDASSQLQNEPAARRMGLVGMFNQFDRRLRQFLNIPWIKAGIDEDALAVAIASLNLHFATYSPVHDYLVADSIVETAQNRISRVQRMDSRAYPGVEVGDDDTDAADGIAP